MDPREQSPDEHTKIPSSLPLSASTPSKATDPDVLLYLSARLLSLAADSRLTSKAGRKLLSEIEKLPHEAERAEVVNCTTSAGFVGRGVLALHRKRMSEELLHCLINLGLDLAQTFPIRVGGRGVRTDLIHGGTIYHLAALEGDNYLLEMLPRRQSLFDAKTASGETPLVLALKYGTDTKALTETIKILDRFGADLSARDDTQRHAFHYSLQYPGANLLEPLLRCWMERNIIPVTRYEVQSGLALALMGPTSATQRTVSRLKDLLTVMKEDKVPEEGTAVFQLVECLDNLIPRKDDDSSSISWQRRGSFSKQCAIFRSMLKRLIEARPFLGEGVIQYLTESVLPSYDNPLIAAAYQARLPIEVLHSIADLGARLSVRFYSGGNLPLEVRGGTLIHHAVNDDRSSVIHLVLERCPGLVEVVDTDGNTPLITHLLACSVWVQTDTPNIDLMRALLKNGCSVDAVNTSGKRAMDYAIEVGCLKTVELLTRYDAAPPRRDADRNFEVHTVKGRDITCDFKVLVKQAMKWRSIVVNFHNEEVASKLLGDSSKILRESKSVYTTYLSLAAAAQAITMSSRARDHRTFGLPLLKLSGSLLFHLPPNLLDGLWGGIEHMSDHYEHIRRSRRHFNEAEMMLLLNHPRELGLHPEQLNPLTRALTATTRVLDEGLFNVPQPVVWNLARIGLYTHGFHLLLKYETENPATYDRRRGWQTAGRALIEERLGMVKIPHRKHTDRIFGPGYLLMASASDTIRARLLRRDVHGERKDAPRNEQYQWYSLDPETMMEFRRGYLLVSNPRHGTLVIRNSSKVFGRKTLRNVAYWAPWGYRNGFSYEDLLDASQRNIERLMDPVLDARVVKSKESTESIYFLLRQLDVIRDFNRRQKFETFHSDAFIRDVETKKVHLAEFGGYRAPGFRPIVEFLNTRFEGLQQEFDRTGSVSKELPALAFARPWYPAWVTNRFEAEEGIMRAQLTINEEVLEVLQAFVEESFTRRIQALDEHYGVTRFFQEAGFQAEGELILVSPKESPKTPRPTL